MFAVGLNLWLNFRLRLWESNWNTQIPECNLVSLDWCRGTRGTRLGLPYCWSRIRRCWSTKSESVQKCLKKRLVLKSVPINMAFCDFSAPCCDWPFEVSLILNLFQSVLVKSNPSMLVDKEWINVEYRFKNAWKKVQLELASFLVHLGGKSVPINMAFRDFSSPCCDWPFEVSLILNLFQSVLVKSNPSMLVDKEWINVEYRFKNAWKKFN